MAKSKPQTEPNKLVPVGANPSGHTLPRYKCHKEVGALKIKRFQVKDNGTFVIEPADEGCPVFEAPDYRLKFRGDEKDLGYYVVYEDGFASWSPTLAFVNGYTRIQAGAPGNAQQASGQQPAVNAVPDKPATDEKPKRTLEQACNEFLGVIDSLAYGSRKRKAPGDLLALRRDLENFMKIGHGILKEPID
jgi:hypothetical protein